MARNLLMSCEELEIAPRFVLHDRDKLLAWEFDGVLSGGQVKVVKTPFRAPDANAYAERWVGSVSRECLDQLILFGMGSLQRQMAGREQPPTPPSPGPLLWTPRNPCARMSHPWAGRG